MNSAIQRTGVSDFNYGPRGECYASIVGFNQNIAATSPGNWQGYLEQSDENGSIIALDAQAMIVLQSDHGADVEMKWREPMSSWTHSSIRERASYLNLVRSPERCAGWLDRPIGQINTARYVLACAEEHAPAFLPERTFVSTYFPGPEGNVVREWQP